MRKKCLDNLTVMGDIDGKKDTGSQRFTYPASFSEWITEMEAEVLTMSENPVRNRKG